MEHRRLYKALMGRRRLDRASLVVGLVIILPLAASIALAGGFGRAEYGRPAERALLEGRVLGADRRESSCEAAAEASEQAESERNLHNFPRPEVLPSGAPRVVLPGWHLRHFEIPAPASSAPSCLLLPADRGPPT